MHWTPRYPPAYFALSIALMLALHSFAPAADLISRPWNWLGLLPLLLGFAAVAACARQFAQHKTPLRPFERSTALVTGGLFRYSRNPIYLGGCVALLGVALLFGSLTPFLLVLLFPIFLHRFFILREEPMMRETFGAEYDSYCSRVRRWI